MKAGFWGCDCGSLHICLHGMDTSSPRSALKNGSLIACSLHLLI